jgi:hypothetical protein
MYPTQTLAGLGKMYCCKKEFTCDIEMALDWICKEAVALWPSVQSMLNPLKR